MKKHMKKREPAEKITRKDLRRDGDFARQLAEEWGMEQTTPPTGEPCGRCTPSSPTSCR